MKTPILSLVVPCYNEQEVLPVFYKEVVRVIGEMNLSGPADTEFIFVDDGSNDNTALVIKEMSKSDSRIHYIIFSRNFGKEAAIYAGLQRADGEYIAVLDVDLQDPPALLPEMLKVIQEDGYDCAATRRVTRKNEPRVRSFFARLFYKIMGIISDVPVVDGARDFRLMNRKYKDAVVSLCERNRFTKGIFPWVGFNTKWFEYENVERAAGKTKWSFRKLFLYSLDGIIGFSTKPLAFAAWAGIANIILSFLLIALIVVRKILFGDPVQGWASLVCIIIFLGGIQLFTIGILGLYLSKIYIEVKQRPIYIAKEML
nr:glycosyltransferase family 2 protein [uncultured Treponema sp.]